MVQSVFLSEMPALASGGNARDHDIGEAQNANVLPFGDSYIGLIKVFPSAPQDIYPAQVYRYDLGVSELESNADLWSLFNGINIRPEQNNPQIDFGVGTWTEPLDSHSNPAKRWIPDLPSGGLNKGRTYRITDAGNTNWGRIGAASAKAGASFVATDTTGGSGRARMIATDGALETGVWYVIESPGTSDFRTAGAPANTAGTVFRATGPGGKGTGTVLLTYGARHGDMAGSVFDDGSGPRQQLWVNVYGYANIPSNRLALIESRDGFETYEEIGEITFNGGNFGATVADVVQRPGTTDLYMLCSIRHAERGFIQVVRKSTDGGRTWSNTGSRIRLSDDPASPRYFSYPVGRIIAADDKRVWASMPASRYGDDWPEANIIAHAQWWEIENGKPWTIWDKAISLMRGPQYSGGWNADYVWLPDGSGFAVHNCFGMHSFQDINTPQMNRLRDVNQYYRVGEGSDKHTAVVQTLNRLAFDNPDYWPFEDGDTVRLSSFGYHLAATGLKDGAPVTLNERPEAAEAQWIMRREGEFFWKIVPRDAPELSLAISGPEDDNRAIGLAMALRQHDAKDAAQNIAHHWAMLMIGDGAPTACYLQNRRSSLGMHYNCTQQPLLYGRPDMIWVVERA
ncbi:hypothetical protein [Pseudooceanicola nanhaiensis]|uniref:hypothetical protein n=1 Tax=Pseudooceanicola nanhaiensis TaxID=375761 RepID=UPI001CD51C73|nr:hypothetical protein [Pseudooceanicola nanhaiensis]MCA0919899.1 hypothetical protein [Pseudooceanicola nanhaiensis]